MGCRFFYAVILPPVFFCFGGVSNAQIEAVSLKLTASTSIEGLQDWDWWQARTAVVPGDKPTLITTMSQTGKKGSHDFHDIYETRSTDGGETWSDPAVIASLKRYREVDEYEVAPGDFWPTWHAKTKTILATGKTFNFRDGKQENRLRERVAYAVRKPFVADEASWSTLKFLETPKKDHAGFEIVAPNAGTTQRVDLPNGEILLPVRYEREPDKHNYTTVVCRCRFDGEQLTYLEHGSELNIPKGRGFYEPSLAKFGERYFLTLRADHSAFVTSGTDGIHFDPAKEWTFDDGKILGSYNTQQHWVTIGGGLFLVYTRRDANNDHIFRHRAPLFIAQVDPDKLQVLRDTEQVLIAEDHATLGNSGICRVSDSESWVTCGEGLLRLGKRKAEKNRVLFMKIEVEED